MSHCFERSASTTTTSKDNTTTSWHPDSLSIHTISDNRCSAASLFNNLSVDQLNSLTNSGNLFGSLTSSSSQSPQSSATSSIYSPDSTSTKQNNMLDVETPNHSLMEGITASAKAASQSANLFKNEITEKEVSENDIIDLEKNKQIQSDFMAKISNSFNFSSNQDIVKNEADAMETDDQEAANLLLNFSNSNTQTTVSNNNGSYITAPGLNPPTSTSSSNGGSGTFVCSICGFSCNSKFHHNSHMNTHSTHQCQNACGYNTRTLGRLKKHMLSCHSTEDRNASNSITNETSLLNSNAESTNDLAADVQSLVDSVNKVKEELMLDGDQSSALDQIKALTEKSALFPNVSINSGDLTAAFNSLASATSNEDGLSSSLLDGSSSAGNQLILNATNSITGIDSPPTEQRRSSGKPKNYKCKQCNNVSTSKEEQWAHARTHIPPEKQLVCPKCDFVTEYKHHLEYHIRNHFGSKPFQCNKCSYSCVNKSMLNSHMKSHTNVYQFRCRDCTYATKYCHSLKLHLRKYNHKRVPDSNGNDDLENFGDSPNASTNDVSRSLSESYAALADNALSAANVINNNSISTSLANSFMLPNIMNSSNPQLLFNQQNLDMNALLRLNSLNNQIQQANSVQSIIDANTPCKLCDYVPFSKEDAVKHNIQHFLSNQQSTNSSFNLSSLSNNQLGQNNFSLKVEMPPLPPLKRLQRSGSEGDDEHMTNSPDVDSASGESNVSPLHSGKMSGDETNDSISSSRDGIAGAKRKKGMILDEISQRLQGKSSPEIEGNSSGGEDNWSASTPGSKNDLNISSREDGNNNSSQIIHQPIPQMGSVTLPNPIPTREPANINFLHNGLLAHLTNLQEQNKIGNSDDQFKFICTHCKMAFADQALYHIHCGYHGYENPFNCNRCGHSSNDALTFNLHLLQGKHD
uniref:Protein hunchback n=1 Tax=Parastrongyloides trichosuri TaxID=131310 RepID=A0A0N4ZRW8_PARTI